MILNPATGARLTEDELRIWSSKSLGVMAKAVRAKFEQNAKIKAKLKATGERLLVERLPWTNV